MSRKTYESVLKFEVLIRVEVRANSYEGAEKKVEKIGNKGCDMISNFIGHETFFDYGAIRVIPEN